MKKIKTFLLFISLLISSAFCQEKTFNKEISLDLLLFQPNEKGLEYAIDNSAINDINGNIVKPNFDWTWGLRTALSLFSNKNTKFSIKYSFILDTVKDRVQRDVVDQTNILESFNNEGIIPIYLNPKGFQQNTKKIRFKNSSSKLDFAFHNMEAEIKKIFFLLSQKLKFLPSFGAKSTLIYQKYKINSINGKIFPLQADIILSPIFAKNYFKNNTYLIGPKIGLDTGWKMYKKLSFFANVNAALLYAIYHTRRKDYYNYQITAQPTFLDEYKIKNNFSSIKPFLQAMLGLSFKKKYKNSFLLNLKVSYEGQIFWKINQMIKNIDPSISSTFPVQKNLQFHGFCLSSNFLF